MFVFPETEPCLTFPMDSISVEALDLSVHDFRVFRHYFKLLLRARRSSSSSSSSKTLAGHTYPALARESIYLSNRSPSIQHHQIYNGPLPTSKGPKLSPFPENHFGISFIGLLSDTGHMGSPFLEATEPDGDAPFFRISLRGNRYLLRVVRESSTQLMIVRA